MEKATRGHGNSSSQEKQSHALTKKARLIEDILTEPDLYRVLGAQRTATEFELRKHYLERSKIVHPDKLPHHPGSTGAFQRLSHAYEILKKPSLRSHYDRESRRSVGRDPSFPYKPTFIGGDQTFKGAVESILNDFLHGDFALVRKLLEALKQQYPNIVNEEVIVALERAWGRIRELILTTRTYALLISIELSRIHRVQKKLFSLGYLDVIGRIRLTKQLVQVTLAVPVRVDRALKRKEEREWIAKQEGRKAVGPDEKMPQKNGGYLLNEKVSKVLEFIVGNSVDDDEEDGDLAKAWGEPSSKEA
ncbi:hypothetical protein RUND412_000534 [Rhizina undulata]